MSIIMDYSLSNGKCIKILKKGQLVEIIGGKRKYLDKNWMLLKPLYNIKRICNVKKFNSRLGIVLKF